MGFSREVASRLFMDRGAFWNSPPKESLQPPNQRLKNFYQRYCKMLNTKHQVLLLIWTSPLLGSKLFDGTKPF